MLFNLLSWTAFLAGNETFCEVAITDDMEDDLTGPTDEKQEDFWKFNIIS